MADDADLTDYEYDGVHTDELLERSRLQALFDARQAAADALRESEAVYQQLSTGVTQQRARNLSREKVRSSVVAYALEAESLLRTEAGRAIYDSRELGRMQVPRQPPLSPNSGHMWEQPDRPGDVAVTGITLPGVPEQIIVSDEDGLPLSIRIIGISSLLDLPAPVTARYSLRSTLTYPGSHDTSDRYRRIYLDTSISAQAFRAINHLLDDLQIRLPVSPKKDGQASGSYPDLQSAKDASD
jgi:hypothetical protein